MALAKGRIAPETRILLTSASRTAEDVSNAEIVNPGYIGAIVFLDITVIPAGQLTLFMEVKDPVTGSWYVQYQSANFIGVSQNRFAISPGVAGGSGIVNVGQRLGAIFRFRVAHLDTNPVTYSLGVHLLV